jgi:hypothetical protein
MAQADLRGPLAIVVGSEGQGLSPVIRRRADVAVRIPMRGSIGSLNAAVAGSILLFAAVAQRDPAGASATTGSAPRPWDETADTGPVDAAGQADGEGLAGAPQPGDPRTGGDESVSISPDVRTPGAAGDATKSEGSTPTGTATTEPPPVTRARRAAKNDGLGTTRAGRAAKPAPGSRTLEAPIDDAEEAGAGASTAPGRSEAVEPERATAVRPEPVESGEPMDGADADSTPGAPKRARRSTAGKPAAAAAPATDDGPVQRVVDGAPKRGRRPKAQPSSEAAATDAGEDELLPGGPVIDATD